MAAARATVFQLVDEAGNVVVEADQLSVAQAERKGRPGLTLVQGVREIGAHARATPVGYTEGQRTRQNRRRF